MFHHANEAIIKEHHDSASSQSASQVPERETVQKKTRWTTTPSSVCRIVWSGLETDIACFRKQYASPGIFKLSATHTLQAPMMIDRCSSKEVSRTKLGMMCFVADIIIIMESS
eukprot:scaffold1072_cov124-Cylindrotheca_fusiformis.AAC.6